MPTEIEFTEHFDGFPAKVFDTTREAQEFTRMLMQLDMSYAVRIIEPRKRLMLPMQTVVMVLGHEDNYALRN